MKVWINISVTSSQYRYDSGSIDREIAVEAEIEGLQTVNWAGLCKGLVENALAEAVETMEKEDE